MKTTLLLLLFPLLLLTGCGSGKPAPETPPGHVLKDFAEIPLLFNGRVMPVDTFSRLHLLQFSGRKSYRGEPAVQWMGRLLFEPGSTEQDTVFLINHPELLDAMGVERFEEIPGKKKPSTRRFSIAHLQPGMVKLEELARTAQRMQDEDKEALNDPEYLVEREALRVYINVVTYRALSHVFSYAHEIEGLVIEDPEIRRALQLDGKPDALTYLELQKNVGALSRILPSDLADGDPASWTSTQMDAVNLVQMMYTFHRNFSDMPMDLLPEAPHGDTVWIPPLDALHNRDGDEALERAAERAAELSAAWKNRDWDAVSQHSRFLTDFSRSRMEHVRETGLTGKEARFNRADYFGKAKIYYLLAFFLALGALVSGNRVLRIAAWVPMGYALLLHITGISWRVFLTARPPVTNLYGTFLFVGLICLLLALLVELFQKNAMGLFAGAFVALTFLFVAERFAAEGDTMHKVVAVLASNFWLSTHVIAVTTGYAGVWIAGVFGHIWLILKLLGKDRKILETVRLPMEGLLGFGLTFAFLGTMLGGVWADQSWGRFWGWDPKENGALLIVLWTAVVYHARIGGMIREVGMAVGTVIGCIMVMIAWLGVNLLGVGLHSYGFTTAMRNGFVGYIVAEVVFILMVLVGLRIFRKSDPA